MSTITREWLQQRIADMEAARDEIPFGLDEDESNTLDALRIALASLEAEMMTLYRERNPYNGMTTGWQELTEQEYKFVKDNASENAEFRTVFTAPPASVSVPEPIKRNDADGWWIYKGRRVGGGCAEWYNLALDDCRAAMLQGAAGGSPVIQGGWVMVPVEPTHDMIWAAKNVMSSTVGWDSFKRSYQAMLAAAPDFRENAETSTNCPCCGRKPLKNRKCSVAGCDGRHVAHGLCQKHYDIEHKNNLSRRQGIREANKKYRARKSAAPQQEVK